MTATPCQIAVHGAAGRMGQRIIEALLERKDAVLSAALVRPGAVRADTALARDFGLRAPDLDYSADLAPEIGIDALIDFTEPESMQAGLALALERGAAFVTGTTGLNAAAMQSLQDAALRIPVLWASNFSLGVALLKHLAQIAASRLGADFDVEIIEVHHRMKKDAPSGTAISLGRAIAEARQQSLDDVACYGRHGTQALRAPGEIGFAAVRAADVIGEHTVLFASQGERLELTHRAGDRRVFAAGAVHAAIWLARQPAGFYDISDVLAEAAV